eukprot:1157395-Pelagomonas_calceolata.AAC.6
MLDVDGPWWTQESVLVIPEYFMCEQQAGYAGGVVLKGGDAVPQFMYVFLCCKRDAYIPLCKRMLHNSLRLQPLCLHSPESCTVLNSTISPDNLEPRRESSDYSSE